MSIFGTLTVAFSMFSAIPVPQVEWKADNMRYALCAFPLVGAVIGAGGWLWVLVCDLLELPGLLRGAGLCLIPILLTGGIHLDGYADTCDALASHGSPQRRQEILHDPHLGAFAAIHLGVYFVASFALWTSLPDYRGGAVLLSFCLSRALSGLGVASLPLARSTGLVHTFASGADRTRVRAVLTVACGLLALALCLLEGPAGAAMAAAGGLAYWRLCRTASRQFGGLSGDLSGWFLQRAELWMLAALCIAEYVEVLL